MGIWKANALVFYIQPFYIKYSRKQGRIKFMIIKSFLNKFYHILTGMV